MKIKLLKESDNTTMKKDVNGVVPIVYADAVNQADEKKKIIADRLKDKKPELKKPFTGTTKQPLPKKEEQAKSELSEALFEDYEDVKQFPDMDHFGDTKGIKKNKTVFGLDGTNFIWHGEWADPEIEYNGKIYRYPDIEDYLYGEYQADCEENGCVPTEDDFDNYIAQHKDIVASAFDEIQPIEESCKFSNKSKSKHMKEEYSLTENIDKQLSRQAENTADSMFDLLDTLSHKEQDYFNDDDMRQIAECADMLHDAARYFYGVDESLTESPTATLERPKKVKDIEELPDDVYTLVYDRLFPGNRKYRPLLAQGLPEMYDEEKFYTKGLGDSDIGVSVKDEADAELAKTVAKELKLKYELKKSNYLRGGNQYIAIIHIPDDISEMTVADYYKKIGKSTDRDDVRMSPSLWSKLRKKAVGESKETSDEAKELTEDAKIIQDLSDFKPWSGAEETLERIKDEDKFDDLDRLIEELYPDGIDETDLNDLLRFESDWVYEQLGIEDEEEGEDDED